MVLQRATTAGVAALRIDGVDSTDEVSSVSAYSAQSTEDTLSLGGDSDVAEHVADATRTNINLRSR